MKDIFLQKPGSKLLMLGNEAIAQGAIEGGVQVVAAYPGTPSSEISETLIDLKEIFGYYAEWSVNEKVAFEVAAGASLVGARSLSVMKGAGLNWAMDTLMTLPLTGVRGGFVIVVADDPGAHYSSNEQDSRIAAQWAGIPCLEPATQQDAKEITRFAFSLSEQLELPVMIRSVTRLSHASGVIELGERETNPSVIGFNKHWKIPFRWNVYGPPGLVDKHDWQLAQLEKAKAWREGDRFNLMHLSESKLGIVGTGIGASYAQEALQELEYLDRTNFWKVTTVFPLPEENASRFLENCDQILVIEEGSSFFENQLRIFAQERGYQVKILGKQFANPLRPVGELTSDETFEVISKFLGMSSLNNTISEKASEVAKLVIPRSSALCAGCPHLGTYWGIEQALPQGARVVPIINGDIGCYEQAGYGIKGQMPRPSDQDSRRVKPNSVYTTLDSLYVMGSGLSMAQGEQRAGYQQGPIVAVAGDSTFFHATIPALLNAVWNQTKLTFVVLDNSWTAMTGHQPSPVTNDPIRGNVIQIEKVVLGLGVPFVKVVNAFEVNEVAQAVREALAFDGVSVVISRGECALQVYRKQDVFGTVVVDAEICDGCKQCIILGCPAVTYNQRKASIDSLMCVNCGICIQACPSDAIYMEA